MASKDKPKPQSQVRRNENRRNGKAAKKHPHTGNRSKGGKFGYSRKRLEQMAKSGGISVDVVIEKLDEELNDKFLRQRMEPRTSAARPGIGDTVFKMDSVHRHLDKGRPWPCVPKGSAHAGKPEKKTDKSDRRPKGESAGKTLPPQRKPMTKAAEMALAASATKS